MPQLNPFFVSGYHGADYFCDRVHETEVLTAHIVNGRNVALVAPRRLGKSGLIWHTFQQPGIAGDYYTFFVDIYETKNLAELVAALGRSILATLMPRGRKAWQQFVDIIRSLQSSLTFNAQGMPLWTVSVGAITHPDTTLDEIFQYLEQADKPCLVAIDEFQVIADYPEHTTEAALRTRIQQCRNAHFIFAGSKQHMMAQMFQSPTRPFYNSTAIMGLEPINTDTYLHFANRHLATAGRNITTEAFHKLYQRFDGITWYVQYILNVLYTLPRTDDTLDTPDVHDAIDTIIAQQAFSYKALLFLLTTKQKQVLFAIADERKATAITARPFLTKHHLTATTVQTAIKLLIERDIITRDDDAYSLSDLFLQVFIEKLYTNRIIPSV